MTRLTWAGYLLGFSLGGFFDGILLHQVLQWHHLLSAVEAPAFRDLRVQVLADGLFHSLMYVIAAAGLWMLWRSRHAFAEPGADRLAWASALIGFGVWHIVDGVLSHWVLRIHRIRMDSGNPLFWDLLWFLVFGVAVAALGWLLRRRAEQSGPPAGRPRAAVAPALLTLAVLTAGPTAALPPPNVTAVLVLFRPGTTIEQAFAAVAAVDGRVIWSDGSGDLWAVDVGSSERAGLLYRHGALLVSSSLLPAACASWIKAAAPG